jgi:hypothetical protein
MKACRAWHGHFPCRENLIIIFLLCNKKVFACDGENSETDTSLDFAKDGQYITEQQHKECVSLCTEIKKMLGSMLNNPSKFLLTVDR